MTANSKRPRKPTTPDAVLPPESPSTSTALAPRTSIDQDVAEARRLQEEIQIRARGFAASVVRYGVKLLNLKAAVGHGKWLTFYDSKLAAPGYSISTAERYMQAAERAIARLESQSRETALAIMAAPSDDPEARDAIAAALGGAADANTWQQLLLGLGLTAPAKRTGGDMTLKAWLAEHYPELVGKRKAMLPDEILEEYETYRTGRPPLSDAERDAARREHAKHFWDQQRELLSEFGTDRGSAPTWGLLDDGDLAKTQVIIMDIARRMARVLKERGASK